MNAPGCTPDARMVASRRIQDRPHFVSPGKAEGEFTCDQSCPQRNGLAVCSHVLAASQSAGKLLLFVCWYQHSKVQKKKGKLTSLARTDMPTNPGRKGGQSNARVRHERLPVDQVTRRKYESQPKTTSSSKGPSPNNEQFSLKKVTSRIKICQGCRTSIPGQKREIQAPPFDFCVVRLERRPYR